MVKDERIAPSSGAAPVDGVEVHTSSVIVLNAGTGRNADVQRNVRPWYGYHMSDPYRSSDPKSKLPWHEQQKPSETERLLWIEFYRMFVLSSKTYNAGGSLNSAKLADDTMNDHIERFGRID